MAQTVIGIFKNSTEAQNAKQYLMSKGFSDEIIDISSQTGTEISGKSEQAAHEEDFGDKLSRFFNDLFRNETEGSKYSKAASSGTVVTVHAASSDQAHMAADILDDYGAVNVDEYAGGYGSGNTNQTSYPDKAEAERLGGFDSGRVGMTDSTRADMDVDWASRHMDSDLKTQAGAESDTNIRNKEKDHITNQEESTTPTREENVNMSNTPIPTGKGGLRSRIIERTVEETYRLRDHVYVAQHIEKTEEYRDVDEKQASLKESLGKTEEEMDAQTRNALKEEAEKQHIKDELHRQRPGII